MCVCAYHATTSCYACVDVSQASALSRQHVSELCTKSGGCWFQLLQLFQCSAWMMCRRAASLVLPAHLHCPRPPTTPRSPGPCRVRPRWGALACVSIPFSAWARWTTAPGPSLALLDPVMLCSGTKPSPRAPPATGPNRTESRPPAPALHTLPALTHTSLSGWPRVSKYLEQTGTEKPLSGRLSD